jgi:hypothetical protein
VQDGEGWHEGKTGPRAARNMVCLWEGPGGGAVKGAEKWVWVGDRESIWSGYLVLLKI